MSSRSVTILLLIAVAAVAVAAGLRFAAEDEVATATTQTSVAEFEEPSTTAAATSTTSAETTTAVPTTTTSTLAPGTTVCDRYEQIEVTGEVQNPDLTEISGVAAGRVNPEVLWVHNDSQDGPYVYAVNRSGASLGRFELGGAFAFDWEDMAAGPGPSGDVSYLYVGDIGDNFEIRGGSITVYRAVEPSVASSDGVLPEVVAIDLQYPEGSPNAEALFVDPVDGGLYVVTRDTETTLVLRADAGATEGAAQTMELVAALDLGHEVTGADISHDGAVIALRGEEHVRLFYRAPGSTIATALSTEPCSAPSPDEIQGEALAFLVDDSYVTASEDVNSPIHRVPRER